MIGQRGSGSANRSRNIRLKIRFKVPHEMIPLVVVLSIPSCPGFSSIFPSKNCIWSSNPCSWQQNAQEDFNFWTKPPRLKGNWEKNPRSHDSCPVLRNMRTFLRCYALSDRMLKKLWLLRRHVWWSFSEGRTIHVLEGISFCRSINLFPWSHLDGNLAEFPSEEFIV